MLENRFEGLGISWHLWAFHLDGESLYNYKKEQLFVFCSVLLGGFKGVLFSTLLGWWSKLTTICFRGGSATRDVRYDRHFLSPGLGCWSPTPLWGTLRYTRRAAMSKAFVLLATRWDLILFKRTCPTVVCTCSFNRQSCRSWKTLRRSPMSHVSGFFWWT